MVPEISTATDTFFFCHLGPFLALTAQKMKFQKNEKNTWRSSFYTTVPKIMIIGYTVPEIWCLTNVIIFHFGLFFALLPPPTHSSLPPPPNSPKKKISKKLKTTPGDVIVLHKWTKNHDYMLYCSWDMAYDLCNCCFQFWAIFCPFTPLTAQKMNISKKFKKNLEMSSFYTRVPKIMIISYTILEIWHMMYVIVVFNFRQFFALLPP